LTTEPAKTVSAVLERFGSDFVSFVAAFDQAEYVLWLGSGISRERVPNVSELLERVLEHLRSHISDDPDGEYRSALDEVLGLATLRTDERHTIDFSVPVSEWVLRDSIVDSLVTQYSRVLDVPVGDQNPEDYLVWEGLDVASTYGSAELAPDVEHYCIAILMLEGLVPSAVTANWDGLLEKALQELTPAFESLVRVAVRPQDFRVVGPRVELIKFHGCAVCASRDADEYRGLLIARHSQISQWTEQPENRSMRQHLETLYTDRLTLMIGLSAQDANLHTVFASGIQNLARTWPASPPAVVLGTERLESYHQGLLKTTYGANHQGNASDIRASALLGAYGKPVLLALVLSSLTEKLRVLMERVVESALETGAATRLYADLISLRDLAASHSDPVDRESLEQPAISEHQRDFIARHIDAVNLALTVFRTGAFPAAGERRYAPVSDRPVTQAILNTDYPSEHFGRLGVALALIGRGVAEGHWSALPGSSRNAAAGVVTLINDQRAVPVYFVKDTSTLTRLELDDSFDDQDGASFVVVAGDEPVRSTRSPRSRYGRDGSTSAGRFSVSSVLIETETVDELYEAFKIAGGF